MEPDLYSLRDVHKTLSSRSDRALGRAFRHVGSSAPTWMPCSQPSRMNTFSSSWLMPSTLLGTLQMRGLGAGITGRAEEEAPFIWGGGKTEPTTCKHAAQRHALISQPETLKVYRVIKTNPARAVPWTLPACTARGN